MERVPELDAMLADLAKQEEEIRKLTGKTLEEHMQDVQASMDSIGPRAFAALENIDPRGLAAFENVPQLKPPAKRHQYSQSGKTFYKRRNGASSHFADASDYEKTVLDAMVSLLRVGNRKVTQESLAQYFCETPPLPYVSLDGRQFRRWNKMYGFTWAELNRRARLQFTT